MSCSTVKPIDGEEEVQEEIKQEIKEKKNMSMVLQKMPEFTMKGYDAKSGHYVDISSEDYNGVWAVVCFYPADFTFVCPTEIAAMNAHLDEIEGELGVKVLAVSTDTHFSHKRFHETEPLLKDLKLTIGADPTGEVSKKFGVYIEGQGVALRGRYLINPEGIIVAEEVQAPMVGRNVKEFVRQIRAWQHATNTGEVCPAGWTPGGKTLPVNTDEEQMTGRVGDYITIEEILS
ncbi:MAG: peroxiredoxin [Campylobacterales bacterium]|nr:peroxiredoxin [Campylobacterales bacterium]